MHQFVHHRVRVLGELLGASVPLQTSLREGDVDFETDATAWLASATVGAEELGLGSETATLARLQTEFALVSRGIDARQMTRVETYRRQFRQAGWSQAIGGAQQTLQEVFVREDALLKSAREQLGQMLIAALQAGLFTRAELRDAHDEAKATELWRRLVDSTQFELVARQLLLTIIDADAVLLTAALARRLTTTPVPTP